MTNIIDRGVGYTARRIAAGERPLPLEEFQVYGFHIGMVMDDSDPQSMGRLWVYIPQFSASSNEGTTLQPTAPPKNDRSKRSGWIVCWPLMPYFGSDNYREDADSDVPSGPNGIGRNPRVQESNTYGFWYQPRIGDLVGCLFAQGDAGNAYWIGCVPKQYQNFMVPGQASSGATDDTTTEQDSNGNFLSGPAHDKNEVATGTVRRKPSRVLFSTLEEAGLLDDPLRGSGTSSARRESPSRVTGIKTVGDPGTLMMGHSIAMDDLPAQQGMRFRTSLGNQVYLCDAGDFIYINTSGGECWIELNGNTGQVNLFTQGSISMHTMTDYNLVVEGNMNVDVRGKFNFRAAQPAIMEYLSGATIRVGQTSGDLSIEAFNNANLLAHTDIRMQAQQNTNISASQQVRMQSGNDFSVTAGGEYREEASSIWMNSGAGAPAVDPSTTTGPLTYQLQGPPQDNPPTKGGPLQTYVAAIVPQHEPWPFHNLTTTGTNGNVTANGAYVAALRAGAITPGAMSPLNIANASPFGGMQAGNYTGNPYTTGSLAEAPSYTFNSPATGLAGASTYSLSDEGLQAISNFEGYSSCPYPDGSGYSIGYGHQIQPSDGITGCISQDQATALLTADTQAAQQCVQNNVTQPINQAQFDSMTSLAYNVGCGAFSNSQMLQQFNAGNTSQAITEWMGFNTSNGQVLQSLTNRRQAEVQNAFAPPATS